MANIIKKYIDIIINNDKANKQLDQTSQKLDKLSSTSAKASSSSSKLSEATDSVVDSMGGMNSTVKDLISKAPGWVKAVVAAAGATYMLAQAQSALKKELKLVTQLTGEQGDAAVKANASIKALSETYGTDYKETLMAVNNLAKQFGTTFDEAMKVYEEGIVSGANATGKLNEQIIEYSSVLSKAGYNQKEFIGLIKQQVKGGIYDDKLIDAIKNFNIEIKDTQKVYATLGKSFSPEFINNFAQGVAAGSLKGKEALISLLEEANRLNLTAAETQKITSDLFTGAGEDAGSIVEIYKQMKIAMEETNKPLSEADKMMQEQLEVSKELKIAQDNLLQSIVPFDTAWKAILTTVSQTITEILGFISRAGKSNPYAAYLDAEGNALTKAALRGKTEKELNEDLKSRQKIVEDLKKKGEGRTLEEERQLVFQQRATEQLTEQIKLQQKASAAQTANLDAAAQKQKQLLDNQLKYQNKVAQYSKQAAIDRLNNEIELADALKSIEKEKVEDLRYRFKTERELTLKRQAEELSLNALKQQEILKAAGRTESELRALAAGGGTEAAEATASVEALMQLQNENADLQMQHKIELANQDEKYAQEQMTRETELQNLYDRQYETKLAINELFNERALGQTSDLEKQLRILERQKDIEIERINLKKQNADNQALLTQTGLTTAQQLQTQRSFTATAMLRTEEIVVEAPDVTDGLEELGETIEDTSRDSSSRITQGLSRLQRDINNGNRLLRTGAGGVMGGGGSTGGSTTASQISQLQQALVELAQLNQKSKDLFTEYQKRVVNQARAGGATGSFSDIYNAFKTSLGPAISAAMRAEGKLGERQKEKDDLVNIIRNFPTLSTTFKGRERNFEDSIDMLNDKFTDEAAAIQALINALQASGGGGGGGSMGLPTSGGPTDPLMDPARGTGGAEYEATINVNQAEYDMDLEEIRVKYDDMKREIYANAIQIRANLTQTYIDELTNQLEDINRTVEAGGKLRTENYREANKALKEQEGIWAKIGGFINNFVNLRDTWFQRERDRIETSRQIVEDRYAFEIKLINETADEELARNAETTKTIMDGYRDQQAENKKVIAERKKILNDLVNAPVRNDREISAAQDAVDQAIKDSETLAELADWAGKFNADTIVATELRIETLTALETEYAGDILQIENALQRMREEAEVAGLEAITDEEKAHYAERVHAFRTLATTEAKIIRDKNNKEVAATKKKNDELDELDETRFQTRMRGVAMDAEIWETTANDLANAYAAIDGVIKQFEQDRIDSLNAEIAAIDEKLSLINELISQAEGRVSDIESALDDARGARRDDLIRRYEAEKNGIAKLQQQEAKLMAQRKQDEMELARIAEQQEKRQRQLATINQVAATASMVAGAANAFQSAADKPWPASLVAIATTIAAVVSAVGTLKSLKDSFEEGGYIKKYQDGGMIDGARHSEGGVPAIVDGGRQVELEGGEYIMSRKTVARLGKDNLDMMNFGLSSPVINNSKFANGGVVGGNIPTSPQILVQPTSNVDIVGKLDELIASNNAVANRPVFVDLVETTNGMNGVRKAQTLSTF